MAHFDKDRLLKVFNEHGVSENNQEVVIEYLLSIQRIGRSPSTLANNVDFIKWLALNVKTDLDKLTKRDVNKIRDKINDLKRKQDGKPAADTTKQSYRRYLKRFLAKYGKEIENTDLARLADFEMAKVDPPRLKPKDLLTEEELNQIILKCKTLRDRTVIALMAETGARVGEICNCTLGDVQPTTRGFSITMRGKTGERPVLAYKCQQLLRQWVSVHPDFENMEAPLFPTTRRYNENSFTVKELRTPAGDTQRKHRSLTSRQIGDILKTAAVDAGITKRVHPHLLRHCAATRFANFLTEQQMKIQLGWTPSSPMPGHYSHIAPQELEKTLLTAYGVPLEKDEKGEIVKKCPRCSKPIMAGLKYCECGMPIDEKTLREYNDMMSDEKYIATMMQLRREVFATMNSDDPDDPKLKMVKDNGW